MTLDPSGLFAYHIGASALALCLYGYDKWAAARQWRRVRERSLHLLALLGGWPGAWLAQRLLRHKTSKAAFQRLFKVTVLLHCAVLACAVGLSG